MKEYRYEISDVVKADSDEEAAKKIRKILRAMGEGEHEDYLYIWEVE